MFAPKAVETPVVPPEIGRNKNDALSASRSTGEEGAFVSEAVIMRLLMAASLHH